MENGDHSHGKYIVVEDHLFLALCDTPSPQGIMAVVRDVSVSIEDALRAVPKLVVIADGLQDPGNMGALVRVADAVGAGAFVSLSNSVDIYNSKVIRATMGSVFHLPIVKNATSEQVLNILLASNYNIVATDARGQTNHFEYNYSFPLAVVFGNEGSGLSPIWQSIATMVRIPMLGKAESLNVATAGAAMLYEIFRQNLRNL
ncbi:MAG: RNA methyltransferase, partial [bacterium]|nr:RNA methyltransferase [bacterium]